ncbi:hypothetical protein MFIFM68171_00920 [Madurella fahalii]|uniref:Transposase IS30-like HTH domain-containing protein n=1 Tax=Madurella fahalii TaxID=1157608 RepID=A0ABQ0FZF4_9PEZI
MDSPSDWPYRHSLSEADRNVLLNQVLHIRLDTERYKFVVEFYDGNFTGVPQIRLEGIGPQLSLPQIHAGNVEVPWQFEQDGSAQHAQYAERTEHAGQEDQADQAEEEEQVDQSKQPRQLNQVNRAATPGAQKRRNGGKRWDQEELDLLHRLKSENKTNAEIGRRLGRTEHAIERMVYRKKPRRNGVDAGAA